MNVHFLSVLSSKIIVGETEREMYESVSREIKR
jgi:hypothetical protein